MDYDNYKLTAPPTTDQLEEAENLRDEMELAKLYNSEY